MLPWFILLLGQEQLRVLSANQAQVQPAFDDKR